jgi:hypothetical protein
MSLNSVFLFIAVLYHLIDVLEGGVITPYTSNPIVLSSTNAGDPAEYTFAMISDNDIPQGGTVKIEFPSNQYDNGLGLPATITAYAPYPTVVAASVTNKTVRTHSFDAFLIPIHLDHINGLLHAEEYPIHSNRQRCEKS